MQKTKKVYEEIGENRWEAYEKDSFPIIWIVVGVVILLAVLFFVVKLPQAQATAVVYSRSDFNLTSMCKPSEKQGSLRIRNNSSQSQDYSLRLAGNGTTTGTVGVGDTLKTVDWNSSSDTWILTIGGYSYTKAIGNNPLCEKPKEETPVCTGNCGTPPTFAGSSTEPPVCSDGSTTQLVANLHVLRNGDSATVNFFITQGDSANIYWRVVGSGNWQNAVSDVKPNSDRFVSFTVGGLNPNLGYDFGIQQKFGCGSGELVTAVVVDGPQPKLFRMSYWTW